MTHIWCLKRIGLWSAVKVGSTVTGILGFFAGVIVGVGLAFFSSLVGMMLSENTARFGLAVLFFFPAAGMVAGALLGLSLSFLSALLFNLVSGILGGIHVEIDCEKKEHFKVRNR